MNRRVFLIPVLLSGLSLAGCQRTTTTVAPFTTELQVAPDQIRGGDGFRVTLSITNRTSRTIVLTSPNGCVSSLLVRREQRAMALAGTEFGCTSAVTAFEFGPEERRTFSYGLAATLDGSDDKLAPPGRYDITAELHLNLPPVSGTFQVLESPVEEGDPENTTVPN